MAEQVAINARAAVREHIGGVERLAREMAIRLPALRPDRYLVIKPPPGLAHRAGHLWEQLALPALAARCALVYSAANLAPAVSRRNVVVIHDAAALRYPQAYSPGYVAYQRRLLPMLVRRARLIITVSEFSRGELVEVLGAAPERVTVIPEGVDERMFAAASSPTISERFSLDRPYVLALGTSSARKNLSILDIAARTLMDRGIELVVAGSERGYLRGGRGEGLRRLGYIPEADLPSIYAGARALVMPSFYEGFGLPCLEAMACGVPVVASRCGALPETVGDAALLVEPDDAETFAEALLAAACEETVRSELIASGRARAALFTWQRTAGATDATIAELLGTGPIAPLRGLS